MGYYLSMAARPLRSNPCKETALTQNEQTTALWRVVVRVICIDEYLDHVRQKMPLVNARPKPISQILSGPTGLRV